jgi:uncharacterized protein with HEPN domain
LDKKIAKIKKIVGYNGKVDCIDDIKNKISLQDTMEAKLFRSLLLYQGKNVNKPFLDILNQFEKMDIINVNEWFEIRDLRHKIAHDYEESDVFSIFILYIIYRLKD